MLARVQRLTAIVADARVGVLGAGRFRGVQRLEREIVGEDLSRCREETARLRRLQQPWSDHGGCGSGGAGLHEVSAIR